MSVLCEHDLFALRHWDRVHYLNGWVRELENETSTGRRESRPRRVGLKIRVTKAFRMGHLALAGRGEMLKRLSFEGNFSFLRKL